MFSLFLPSVLFQSYIKCKNVDYGSQREETFFDIQLNVKGKKNGMILPLLVCCTRCCLSLCHLNFRLYLPAPSRKQTLHYVWHTFNDLFQRLSLSRSMSQWRLWMATTNMMLGSMGCRSVNNSVLIEIMDTHSTTSTRLKFFKHFCSIAATWAFLRMRDGK